MTWESDGPYYEDLEPNITYKHWPGRTVSLQDNVLWSSMSMDFTPLYLDEEYAKRTDFRRCVMNPRFVRAVIVGMCVKDTTRNSVAHLSTEFEEFLLPVYPGDTLYAQSTVVSKRESASRPYAGIVTYLHAGYNQAGKVVYRAKRTNMIYKKGRSSEKSVVESQ